MAEALSCVGTVVWAGVGCGDQWQQTGLATGDRNTGPSQGYERVTALLHGTTEETRAALPCKVPVSNTEAFQSAKSMAQGDLETAIGNDTTKRNISTHKYQQVQNDSLPPDARLGLKPMVDGGVVPCVQPGGRH